jgi:hypothetical protein
MGADRKGMFEAYSIGTGMDAGRRFFVGTVKCDCGRTLDMRLRRNMPPEKVIQNAERQGWRWRGRHQWDCDACRAAPPIKPSAIYDTPPPQIAPPPRPSPPLPMSVIIPKDSKLEKIAVDNKAPPPMAKVRKIMDLLESHFDADKGTYTAGWHDQRIADEVNEPRAAIMSIREEAFGPIRVHPEITELRGFLAGLEAECEKVLAQLSTLTTRIDDAKKRVELIDSKLLGKAA